MKTLNVALKYPCLMSISGPVTLASFDPLLSAMILKVAKQQFYFSKKKLCAVAKEIFPILEQDRSIT